MYSILKFYSLLSRTLLRNILILNFIGGKTHLQIDLNVQPTSCFLQIFVIEVYFYKIKFLKRGVHDYSSFEKSNLNSLNY